MLNDPEKRRTVIPILHFLFHLLPLSHFLNVPPVALAAVLLVNLPNWLRLLLLLLCPCVWVGVAAGRVMLAALPGLPSPDSLPVAFSFAGVEASLLRVGDSRSSSMSGKVKPLGRVSRR